MAPLTIDLPRFARRLASTMSGCLDNSALMGVIMVTRSGSKDLWRQSMPQLVGVALRVDELAARQPASKVCLSRIDCTHPASLGKAALDDPPSLAVLCKTHFFAIGPRGRSTTTDSHLQTQQAVLQLTDISKGMVRKILASMDAVIITTWY